MKQRMEKKKQMKTSPPNENQSSVATSAVRRLSGLAATKPPSSPRLPPLTTWPPSWHPGGSLSPRLAGQTPPSSFIKILHEENHTKLVVLPERRGMWVLALEIMGRRNRCLFNLSPSSSSTGFLFFFFFDLGAKKAGSGGVFFILYFWVLIAKK
nr:hypothetical protein Itr_chr11CG03450 [Ipomoea trifida]